jgi:hypothetical protein
MIGGTAARAPARHGGKEDGMATESEVPEFYVDQFTVTAGTYGLTMTFGLTPPHPAPGQAAPSREVARLRMSLEHAKVMAMILRRQLKRYEEEMAPINIPMKLSANLGISPEDW